MNGAHLLLRTRTLALASLGVAALLLSGILYLRERSRLSVRGKNTSVQGEVTKASEGQSGGKIRRPEFYVEYRYVVGGRTHESGERRIGGPIFERQPIQVWYDPASPGRCVSDPELAYGMNIKFVVISGVGGLVLLVSSAKSLLPGGFLPWLARGRP